ncbi:MAG TPA: sigma 54-interacting transcriptional regulator, partial [Desulfobaccales bacterium]
MAEGLPLFLDEINTLSLTVQAKLLRFLQDHTYRALGAGRDHTADVRIISASNADLAAGIQTGKFRQDL